MRRARLVGGRAASGALLPPAAFAVHQLRYALAYGAGAGAELERTGHSYLHSMVPWLSLLLALAAGGFLRALGRAFTRQTTVGRYSLSFIALWLACTGSLVAIFATQELLEGWLVLGHPSGLVGIFGYGGWWAVPVAACVALVLAAAYHGARWIVDAVARRAWRARSGPRLPGLVRARPPRWFAAAPAPLLAGWSTRGPPAWR
jgi:hypothetical protein